MRKKSYFLILFLAIVLSLPKALLALTGDFDGSGVVDGKDLMKLARSFGSSPGSSNWNPVVDIDGNGIIGPNDLISLAPYYGRTTTPPARVSGLALNPGNNKIDIQWTNPSDSDFKGVLILRRTGGAPAGMPTSGSAYIVGDIIGDGTVVYNSTEIRGAVVSWTDNGVSNGNQYYYAVFTYDDIYNYSAGEQDFGVPSSAVPDITSPPSVAVIATNTGTGGSVNLDWSSYNETSVGDVDLYKVYQSSASFTDASTLTPIKIVPVGTKKTTVTGLTNGVTYYFAVTSVDKSSNENKTVTSVSVVPTDSIPPSDVTGVTASNKASSEGTVTVTWSANTESDLNGYKIYYSTGAITNVTTATLTGQTTGGATTFTVTGLTDGTTYTFAVTAVDKSGNEDTAPSDTKAATPLDGLAPGALSTVTAASKAGAEGTVTVSWNPSTAADAAGYKVYYSTSAFTFTDATGATLAGTAGAATTSYNIPGLTDGTTYYFGVTAVDEVPNENKTISANPSATPVDAAAPGAVSGFYASPGNELVALTWTNPTNADFAGVRVVRKTGSYPASVADGTLVYTGTGTGHTDTGLPNDTTYYYAAFSYDEVPNYSAQSPSAQDSATPYTGASGDTTPPGLPTGVAASYNSVAGVTTVTWTDQTTTTESPSETYSVYRYTAVIDGSNIGLATRIAIGVVKGAQTFAYTVPADTDGLFYYAITSSDALGNESAPVSIAIAVDEDNKPPVSVKNLTATAGNAQATLTWVNPTADYVGTLIIRKTTGYPTSPADGTVIFTDTTNAGSYTDTPLSNGTKYYYAAFAYDDIATPNYSALGPGSLDSATPSAAAMTSPSNLAVSAGSSSFNATWNAVGGASGYIVYYDNDAAGPPYGNAVNVGAATSFALQGIPSLSTYYFTATAYVTGPPYNESPFASEVSATTTDQPVIKITGMDTGVTLKINGTSYIAGNSLAFAKGTTLTIESIFNGHTYTDVVEAHYDLDIYVHAVDYGATHPGYVAMSSMGYSDYDIYIIESTDTSLLNLDIDHGNPAKIIGLHIISPNVYVSRYQYMQPSYVYGTLENNGNMTIEMGYYAHDHINRLSANNLTLDYYSGSSYEYKIQELMANKVTISDRQVSIFNLSITGGNLYAYDFDRNYLNANLPDLTDGMVWFKARNPSVYGLYPGIKINTTDGSGKSISFGDGYYGDRVFWETKLNEDLYWYNNYWINDAYFLGPYTEINRLDWYFQSNGTSLDVNFGGNDFGIDWNPILSNTTTGYGFSSDGTRVYSPINIVKVKSGVVYIDDSDNTNGGLFRNNAVGQDILLLSDTNTLDFQCQEGCFFDNNVGSHWVVEDDLNYLNYTPESASIDITTSNIVRNGTAGTVSVTANNTYTNSTMYVAYRLKNALSTQFTRADMTYSGSEWTWGGTLSAGSYYFYVVAVQNDGSFGKVKEYDIVMEGSAPTVPLSVAAEPRNGGTHISWTASSDGTGAGVAGYKVHYGTTSGGPFGTTVDVGNQQFADIALLTNGTPYYFVVSAYDYNGNESVNSSEVFTTPEGLAPAAPTGLSATNPGSGRTLHLSWSLNGEGDMGGYYVKYGITSGAYTNTVDAGNVISFDLTGLTDGTPYYLVISAYDTARNESGNSSEVSGTPTDTTAPSVVIGATVSPNGYPGELVVSWTNPPDTDYDHLNIYRSSSSGTLGDLVTSATSSYQKFMDTGLTTGTTYYYTFRPVDGTGNENATATQYSGAPTDVLAPKAPTGEANAFSDDVMVNSDASTSDYQYEPDIAVDKNGNVYMVWYGQENGGSYYIWFAKSTDGGKTFGQNIRVDGVNGYDKYYPSITLDASGNIYVAWMDYRNSWDGDIYFAKSTNGGTSFSANVRVTDDVINNESQDYPDITVDGSGNIYIAWRDYRDDSDGWYEDIYLAKSSDGGATFGANVRVNDSSADDKYYPSIGTDSSGNVYVAWEDQRNGYSDIYVAKSTDGGANFGTNVKVDSGADNGSYRPSLKVDRNDNLHLTWHDNRNGNYDIFYAKSTNGGTSFGTNIQVNDGSANNKDYPDIAVDASGAIHVVWRDYRNSAYDVFYASSTNGGTSFGTNILVDDSTGTSYVPAIASDRSGNIYTTWYDNRNGNYDIYFSRMNRPPTVTNAYNGNIDVAWTANGEADIAGYKIHYGTTSGAYTTTIDAGNVTTYQLTGMTWNQTYYIAVSSYDTSGNEGIKSLEASGMTTDGNLPAAPTGLTASDVLSDQGGNISLSWNKSADEGAGFNDVTEYRVYRSTTSGSYTGSIATVAANASATYTYTDPTANKLIQYYYIVRAFDGTNESADSIETGPVRGVDNLPPAAPTGTLSFVQTGKAEFEAGTVSGLNTTGSPGAIRLGNNMTRFISAGIDYYDRVYYVQANNDGTFGTPAYLTLNSNGNYHRSGGAVADFDNDGDYDIVFASDNNGYAYIAKQTSPGVFASPVQVGSYVYLGGYEMAMTAGDFTEDGNMDFILAGYYNDIWLYTGDGTGGFTTSIITTDAPNYSAREMDAGDINEDGHLDFVYSESYGNIYAFYGNGNGTFSSPSLIVNTGSSDTYALTLADFNNDGHLDIIEGGYSSDDLDLYLGDGAGNFTYMSQVIPSDGYYHSVDSYDFDNDGDMDILVGNASLENVSYYANNGDGTFAYVSKPIGDYAGYYYLYGVAAPDDKRVTVGTLLSSSFDTVSGMSNGMLYFDGNATVTGTAIKFQIRSAATEAGLATAVWYGPAGTADYYTSSGSFVNLIHNGDRWIQYQLTLEGDTWLNKSPVVRSVTITYGSEQGAPFAVDAPNDQGGSINISWKLSADDGAGANDVTGYEIHRSNNPGFAADSTTLIAAVPSETWGYGDTTVPLDKKPYYYIVRAGDGENFGNSLVTSATFAVTDPTGKAIDNIAPAAPTNSTVVDTPGDNGGNINISWTLSTDDGAGANDVAYYDIYRSPISGFTPDIGNKVGSVAAGTSLYTDTTATIGASFYYIVRARDGHPNYSGYSEAGPVASADNVADPPQSLAASDTASDNGGSITVTWNKSPDEGAGLNNITGYRLYRGTTTGFTPATSNLIASLPASGAASYTATDTGATTGTTYFYIARSTTAFYESANSNEASASSVNNLIPAQVQNLKAANGTTAGNVLATWTANSESDLSGYKLYYDNDASGAPYANVVSLGKVTEKSLTGLASGSTYYFAISAVDSAGNESPISNEVSLLIAADSGIPVAPIGVSAADTPSDQGKSITVIWTLSTDDGAGANDVAAYDIYRGTTSIFTPGAGNKVGTVAAGISTYADSSPQSQTPPSNTTIDPAVANDYYYIVRARDGAGNYTDSAVTGTAANATDNTAPGVPAGVKRWVQTSQADFSAGTISDLSGSVKPGSLKLAESANKYIVAGHECGSNYIYLSNGDGSFTYKQNVSLGCYQRGYGVADFDNDGDYDIVTGNGSASMYIILQTSPGVFASPVAIGSAITLSSYTMDMAAADFNNDGNYDFIVGGNNRNIYLFTGDGAGGFTTTTITTTAPGSAGRGKDAGDINEDGNMDFVYAEYSTGQVYAYYGNGNGTFGTPVLLFDTQGSSNDPYGVTLADFTGDGNLDIIAGGSGDGQYDLWAGDGVGGFIWKWTVFDMNNYSAVDDIDFDGDGDQDLVVTRYNSYDVRSYKNNGDGTFTDVGQIGTTYSLGIGAPSHDLYKPSGNIISSAHFKGTDTLDRIYWSGSTPAGTKIKFQIRTATTEAGLDTAQWYGPISATDYYETSGAAINTTFHPSSHEWIQYRAVLETTNPRYTPQIDSVEITYGVNPTVTAYDLAGDDYNRVVVEWSASGDDGSGAGDVTRYDLYRGTTSGFTPDATNRVAQVTATGSAGYSYIDTVPALGTDYYYKVRAYDATSYSTVATSNAVQAIAAGVAPATGVTVSDVPSDQGYKLKVDWNLSAHDAVDVTGYEVFRSEISGGPYTSVGSVAAGSSTFTDTVPYSNVRPGDWSLASNESFDSGATGWTKGGTAYSTVTNYGVYGNALGGYNQTAGGIGSELSKTYDLSAYPHAKVRIVAEYLALDSWDGESAYMKADGTTVFSQNNSNTSHPVNVSNTGGWNDEKITIDQTIDHTGNSLALLFGSTLDQGATDESYAVADVKIYVLNATESADYFYIVRAKDGSGHTSDSNEASGVAHDNIAPAAPTGILNVTHTSKADFERGTLTNLKARSSGKVTFFNSSAYISIGTDNGMVYYARSVGDGTFDNVGYVTLNDNHRGGAVADFDNDGDYDIAAANDDDGYAYIIKQTSPGVFASPVQIGSYLNLSSYEMAMSEGDFNEDGNMDFLLAGNNDDIYLYLGDGTGGFTTTTITTDAPYYYAREMDSGDINKDGHLDFIYGESYGYIYAYYGKGDGTFLSPVQLIYNGYGDIYALSLADFNGDGNLDIIEGGGYYDDLDLYLGDGAGNFTYSKQATGGRYNNAIDNFDFDSDGDQDIILADYYNYNAQYLRNDGSGSFTYVSTPVTTNNYNLGAAVPSEYDSSKIGTFVSSVFDLGSGNNPVSIGWKAEVPAGSSVKFQIRSAVTESGLSSAAWYGPAGTGDYYTVSGTAINSAHNGQRWMQYKSFLERTTIEEMPALDSVTVTFGSPQAAPFVYDAPGDNGGNITINWMPSTDDGAGVNDVAGYEIHRSTTSGFTPDATTLIGSVSAGTMAYVDGTAVDATDYYYIVQAKDLENKTGSAQAGPVQSVNDGAPAEVTSLTAVPHDGYIDLSWTNPAVDFAGVMVRRSATAYPTTMTDGVEVYNGPANTVSDTNLGANDLQFGTTYYYTLFAYDGMPNYSKGVNAAAVPVDETAPVWTTTAGVQSATAGNGSVLLTWGAAGDLNATTSSNSAPVTFKVYVNTASPATSGTVIADIASSPYTVTGLSNDKVYYFTVRAVDAVGNTETNVVEMSATPYVKFTDQTAALSLGDTGSGRGVAVADVNGDGTSDIFVANYGSANKLFVNIAGAWFDNSTAAGVAGTTENSAGALFADLNNDGHPDLYVSNYGSVNLLYMNNGNGTFTLSGQAGGGTSNHMGAAAGDIDNDGDLDIYVANDAAPNFLFINNGDGTFTESAATYTIAGVAENSSMALMVDFNQDGKLDILVINSGQANQYYEQTGAMVFTEKAAAYGISDTGGGQGVSIGDVDRDGDMDVYVTRNGANRLYINGGIQTGGVFTEEAATRGVADASNSAGAVFVDIDHDGDIDLYSANTDAANRLYINNGAGVFTDNAVNAGVADAGISYGVAAVDGDFDGDMDIYVVNSGANSFFRAEQNNNAWLKVKLLGTSGNKDAVGARVEVYEAGFIGNSAKLLGARLVTAGSGYASSEDKVLHLGLTMTTCDVRVVFPDGTTVDRTSVAEAQTIIITEPGTVYANDFDGNVTGLASLSNTTHFYSGTWGATGNGYWCGEDGTYATANGWSGGAGYGNNWDEKLTISGIDLRGSSGASLLFKMRHDMEANYEFGYVEVSTNGGTTWTAIQTVTGVLQTWTLQNINLSSYVGNIVSLRFRFVSDSSWSDQDGGYDSSTNGFDGAFYIDDLTVSGSN